MKIHIVSLQRTGSKSLYNAIHKALPNPLTFQKGVTLGELFHGWGSHGYKFGLNAEYPFDQKAEIAFRTAYRFHDYVGKNFVPRISEGVAEWVEHPYLDEWTDDHVEALRTALLMQLQKDVLVKSQLLDGSFSDVSIERLLRGWNYIVTITPKDPLRWVCSNYLCDRSGVFVPVDAQKQAANKFQECRVVVPVSYVREKLSVLKAHWRTINNIKTPVIHLFTEELSTSQDKLAALGLGTIDVPMVKEFSDADYSTMIFNYDEVVHETSNFL